MASLMEIPNAERAQFDEICEQIKMRKNYVSPWDISVLVTLYKKYGHTKTLFVIMQCMGNDWLKSGRWEALAEVVSEFGIDRTLAAIRALNRLENHSIEMVDKLCRQPQLAHRTKPGAKDDPARAKAERPYPPKDHRYTQYQAGLWMTAHEHPLGEVLDYFENGGRDADGTQLYLLKSEYR